MTDEQRAKIAELEGLLKDMRELQQMYRLEAEARSELASWPGHDDFVRNDRHEQLRRSLQRRVGGVRPLVYRFLGYGMADGWTTGFGEEFSPDQPIDLGRAIDQLEGVIGRLEADPSLLNPPPAPTPQPRGPQQSGAVFQGPVGQVTYGQTVSGAVSQQMTVGTSIPELVQLFEQLRGAIEGEASEEAEQVRGAADELRDEVQRAQPRFGTLIRYWGYLTHVATLETTIQAGTRAQKLINDHAPMMEAFIRTVAGGGS